jgi:hypothetical protein
VFGNYETPAVISKVGKAKLAKGEPLDMTVYGRKEFPRESTTQRIGITADNHHQFLLPTELNGYLPDALQYRPRRVDRDTVRGRLDQLEVVLRVG